MTTTQYHPLFSRAIAADNAWQAELENVFGKDACNARYYPKGQGEPGTNLRRRYNEWRAANDAWTAFMRARNV